MFYHNEQQKEEKYKDELNKSRAFDKPIIPEIAPFTIVDPAEIIIRIIITALNHIALILPYIMKPKISKFKYKIITKIQLMGRLQFQRFKADNT